MFNGGQMRRKRHVEVFPGRIGHKILAFPKKIMMMGDRRHAGFRNDFGKRYTQGDIQRYRQRVFRYQQIDFEFFNELVEAIF